MILPIADPDSPNRCQCQRSECFHCSHQRWVLFQRELAPVADWPEFPRPLVDPAVWQELLSYERLQDAIMDIVTFPVHVQPKFSPGERAAKAYADILLQRGL
jgi:hypothetical protein